MLIDKSVTGFLAALASADPTPGGGSASALASAAGASLLMMVAALPRTRSGAESERTALETARGGLASIQRQLADSIDADAAAYDRVTAAYKRPKSTEAEKAVRKSAIQDALRTATDVPLEVMRLSLAGIEQARIVAQDGHRAAASDVGVALALLRAGLAGARLNVDINLGGISEPSYVEAIAAEARRLAESARIQGDAVDGLLQGTR